MNKLILSVLVYLASTAIASAGSFSITSSEISAGGKIANEQVLNGFGCKGDNVSPSLQWKNPPAGTKSFAITAYDPDAPTGSGWWHWVIFNIPAEVRSLPKNAGTAQGEGMPAGSVQSQTDFGNYGYGGPVNTP